jgi:hypothetical protein
VLLVLPRGALAAARPVGRRAALALALAAYALTAAASLLAGAWLSRSVLGITGRVELSMWHRAAFAQDAYGFTGALWRQGRLACPAPGSCASVEGCACAHAPAIPAATAAGGGGVGGVSSLWQALAATLAGGPERAAYAESDFWDGAFSSNENFFYPIHALVDLMAFQWAAAQPVAPSAANDFLGASRVRAEGCSGTALSDVLSEEFCFTEGDTGLPVAREPGRRRSGQSAADPGQPCLTVEELFEATLPGRAPYTYDVVSEQAVWRAVEPQVMCPPAARLCATNRTPVLLTGSLECWRRDNTTTDAACPEPRPSAPSRTCTCADALVRERAEAVQAAARRRLPPAAVWLAALLAPLLVALPASCASLRRSERYSALRTTEEPGLEREPDHEDEDEDKDAQPAAAAAATLQAAANEAGRELGAVAALERRSPRGQQPTRQVR